MSEILKITQLYEVRRWEEVKCDDGVMLHLVTHNELNILKQYEPNKHTAMMKLLGNAYQYKK